MTTRLSAREVLDRSMSEAELERWFVDLCRVHGATTYHTHDSRRSDPGFPDRVVITKDHRLGFVELKRETGRVRPEQVMWGILLDGVAQRTNRVRYFLLRPSTRGDFEKWIS